MKVSSVLAAMAMLVSVPSPAVDSNIIRVFAPVSQSSQGSGDWVSAPGIYSDWVDAGDATGCVWTPEASTVSSGKPFVQTGQSCEQGQQRSWREREFNSKTGEYRYTSEPQLEFRSITSQATRDMVGENPSSFYAAAQFGSSTSTDGFLRAGIHNSIFDGNANFGSLVKNQDGYAILMYLYKYGSGCLWAVGAANGEGWNGNPRTELSSNFVSRFSNIRIYRKDGSVWQSNKLEPLVRAYNNGHYKEAAVSCVAMEYLYSNYQEMGAFELY